MNYPVDTTKKFVLWNKAENKAEKVKINWQRPDGGEIVGLDKNLVYLYYQENEKPKGITEKIIRIDWPNETYVVDWRVAEETKESIFRKKIEDGFLVSPENFVLGLSNEDRAAFTSLLTLLNNAGISDSFEVEISDKTGNLHKLAYKRLKEVLVSYGLYFQKIWKESKEN